MISHKFCQSRLDQLVCERPVNHPGFHGAEDGAGAVVSWNTAYDKWRF